MNAPEPGILALGRRYRLGLLPRPRGGRAGEVLGRGVGASVEFQDRRAFLPGDDLRRLDWRALARTDRMLLRQHREEVAPVLELLVDASRSMAVEADKAQRTVELVALLLEAARGEGWRARLRIAEGEAARPFPVERLLGEGLPFEGRGPLEPRALAAGLSPGALVILVSDLLFPGAAAGVVNVLAARAGRLAVLQVLGAGDLRPSPGTLRLTDAESGLELERALDATLIAAYQARLARHTEGWSLACRRVGAAFVSLDSEVGLDDLAGGPLVDAGVLTPASVAGGARVG